MPWSADRRPAAEAASARSCCRRRQYARSRFARWFTFARHLRHETMKPIAIAFLACSAILCGGVASAADSFQEEILDSLTVRPIGPANMAGRVTAVAVAETRPSTIYLATASGGLWKTTNRGTSWRPIFE